MNFIVGKIIKYLTEEQTFWVFTHMTENQLPLDYYSGMIGIMVDQKVFEHILKASFPKMVHHMQKHFYQLDLIAFQWLVTLFMSSLNHETELFCLTAFLLKGQKVIIRIALLIVDHLRPIIMKCDAFDQIYMTISKDPMTHINPAILCKQLKTKRLQVTNTMLTKLREQYRPQMISKIQHDFHSSFKSLHRDADRGIKFLNNFYLFNGLSKYYEQLLK